MKRRIIVLILVLLTVVIVVSSIILLINNKPLLPVNTIEPQSPHYLAFSSGNQSKIFLLSAKASYGYWSLNDTHMDWTSNGPIIHNGDPVLIINATIRNDYPVFDQNSVNSDNTSFVVLSVKCYEKNGNIVDLQQAYPQVDIIPIGHVFSFESGKTYSFGIYLSLGNKSIDHYEIVVAIVSNIPPP